MSQDHSQEASFKLSSILQIQLYISSKYFNGRHCRIIRKIWRMQRSSCRNTWNETSHLRCSSTSNRKFKTNTGDISIDRAHNLNVSILQSGSDLLNLQDLLPDHD